MSTKTYEHETQIFNPDTGETFHDTKYSITAVNNEEDYIKVYRYLNTVFAFKGIGKKLIPTLMEIWRSGGACYITATARENVSRRLFFSTVATEQIQIFCA